MRKVGEKGKSIIGKAKTFHYSKFHTVIENRDPYLKGKFTETEWRKLSKIFWDKVGDILTKQPNGVVLDGLGYFCFAAYKKRFKLKRSFNVFNGGLLYSPQFFGDVFKNKWAYTFNIHLSHKVFQSFYREFRNGMPYKSHLKHVRIITGNGRKYIRPTKRVYR